MLAIFAGCFVGVTLGRFIPERFNSAIEKGIALCVFYIGLDGVLAGSDTLVAILSMVLGVIPVSYTHLDVYKRQVIALQSQKQIHQGCLMTARAKRAAEACAARERHVALHAQAAGQYNDAHSFSS